MIKKISTADARKEFANVVNRVAFGKTAFVLTRHGNPLAAIVSIEDLMLLQELREQTGIDTARRARKEPGEDIPWEKLREDLDR